MRREKIPAWNRNPGIKSPGLSRGLLGTFRTGGILSTGTLEQSCSMGNLQEIPTGPAPTRRKFSPWNHQEEREDGTPTWKKKREKNPPGEILVCLPPIPVEHPFPLDLHPWMSPGDSHWSSSNWGTQGSFSYGKMGHQHGKEMEKNPPGQILVFLFPSMWSIHPLWIPIHGCVQLQDTFPDFPSPLPSQT